MSIIRLITKWLIYVFIFAPLIIGFGIILIPAAILMMICDWALDNEYWPYWKELIPPRFRK